MNEFHPAKWWIERLRDCELRDQILEHGDRFYYNSPCRSLQSALVSAYGSELRNSSPLRDWDLICGAWGNPDVARDAMLPEGPTILPANRLRELKADYLHPDTLKFFP